MFVHNFGLFPQNRKRLIRQKIAHTSQNRFKKPELWHTKAWLFTDFEYMLRQFLTAMVVVSEVYQKMGNSEALQQFLTQKASKLAGT